MGVSCTIMYIYLLVLLVAPAANPSRETQQFLVNADHSTEKRKEEENGGRGVVAPANSSVFPRVPSFASMDERAKVHVHVHVHVAYCLQAKHDIVYAYIIIHVQYTLKKLSRPYRLNGIYFQPYGKLFF